MSIRLANRQKYVKIDSAASGKQTLVAGVADRKIRVTSYVLVAGGTVTATWGSDLAASVTALSGALPMVANGSLAIAGSSESPVLECGDGADLVLTRSAAIQISGHVAYTLEPTD